MDITNKMIDEILSKNNDDVLLLFIQKEANQKNNFVDLHKFSNLIDRVGRIFTGKN